MTEKRAPSNAKTAAMFGGVVVFMVGLSFAAIPLYEAFCKITGFGGTPLRAESNEVRVLDETITVRFDANVDPKLPWTFKPVQKEMTLPIGESGLAFYTATNTSDKPVAGTSTFNVTPLKIGGYFVKIDCFCFTEQVLQPGESVDMPVSFYIDPEIRDDRETEEVQGITLSYTFFETEISEPEIAGVPDAEPTLN
jgi:cytochrome c oxidase assembly protein subunit 11